MKEISHYQFIIAQLGVSSDSRNMYVGVRTVLCLAVCEGDGWVDMCVCNMQYNCDINLYWPTVYEHTATHPSRVPCEVFND